MTREELDAMNDEQLLESLAQAMENPEYILSLLFRYSSCGMHWAMIGRVVEEMKNRGFDCSFCSGYPTPDSFETYFNECGDHNEDNRHPAFDTRPARAVVKAALLALSTK